MKVSVLIITYNHEQFIAQALDSILMQEVEFDWEIVVGEDCSTDGTRQILLEYQTRYPERIRLLFPERNLGMLRNFVETFRACRGEYIAILEGDDYWINVHKLQKQVDYLAAHPQFSACFHDACLVNAEGERLSGNNRFIKDKPNGVVSLHDVVTAFCIPSCSSMFRRAIIPDPPAWFLDMPMGDWPLHIVLADHGPIGYLDEVLAAYRIHGGGIWSSQSRLVVLDRSIWACKVVNVYLAGRFRPQMARKVAILEYETAFLLARGKRFRESLRHLVAGICTAPFSPLFYYPASKLRRWLSS